MSKNFFYDYKIELQEQLGKKFRKQLATLDEERAKIAQLDVAQKIIINYFDNLKSSLADIILVSNNQIALLQEGPMIVKFVMFNNYLKFTRFDQAIEVEVGQFDTESQIIEARIISNIIPGDKKCVVKKIGKVHDGSHFDDKTVNFYIHEAFKSIDELEL